MNRKANSKFHVRIYTEDGSKLEMYSDPKRPTTHQEIIDGLKRAIDLVEKVIAAEAKK